MYSKEFIEDRRKELLAERERLRREIASIAKYDPELDRYRPTMPEYDKGDVETPDQQIDEKEEYARRLALLQDLLASISDVEDALKKIDEGKYGISEKTGRYLSEERLRAYPAARAEATEEE